MDPGCIPEFLTALPDVTDLPAPQVILSVADNRERWAAIS
jgi:hypothetical protein